MSKSNSPDWLRAFVFNDLPVRGAMVSLHDTWQALSARRQYPEPLNGWLADMLTSIALVRSGIKASGRLSLQVRTESNPHLLSTECDEHWQLRGMARYQDTRPLITDLSALQNGLLTMQLEPPDQQVSYQGVVSLTSTSIAEAMQQYFLQSEQLATQFVMGAAGQQPWGLMLQRMPGEMDEDDWQRLMLLAGTLQPGELLQVSPDQLLQRLFPKDEIELFAAQSPSFCCGCSRARVSIVLLQLGHSEALQIIEEQNEVEVGCEHCGERYAFDSIDIEELFANGEVSVPVSHQMQ